MYFTAAAAVAMSTVRALSEVLQPATFQQNKLTLPTFWMEDPVGWFQHAEAAFVLPANSYVRCIHVMRALPLAALKTVPDLTQDITGATPEPYLLIKEALLSCFTSSP
jgi:hypothetical protein